MATDPIVVPTVEEHLAVVAAGMRAADVSELCACTGEEPLEGLVQSFRLSEWARTVLDEEGAVAVFGVAAYRECGVPWLLATPRLVDCHRRWFVSHTRQWLEEMQAQFSRLENYVDARNLASIRWLRWAGFTIHPAAPFGQAGLPFHRFVWEANHV